jgi:hypothetical protein
MVISPLVIRPVMPAFGFRTAPIDATPSVAKKQTLGNVYDLGSRSACASLDLERNENPPSAPPLDTFGAAGHAGR